MTNTDSGYPPSDNDPGSSAPRTRPRYLLIADDSGDMRRFIRDAVGAQFDEVREVADGRALFWALMRSSFTVARTAEPELVLITDVAMPAYDGLQVLDAWSDAHHGVPSIVITAFPSEAVQARARELGVRLLAKPVSVATLRRHVRDVLAVLGGRAPA
jgi:CheY-like chemotaxis protein